MTKTRTRLERLERAAPRQVATLDRLTLLDAIVAKSERVLAGDAAEPADWTNAPAALVAHRERLLEWVRTKHA